MKKTIEKIKDLFIKHWKGIGATVTGIIIGGLIIPFIQNIFIESPKISIEINNITKEVVSGRATINLAADEDLKVLDDFRKNSIDLGYYDETNTEDSNKSSIISIDLIEDLIKKFDDHVTKQLPQIISNYKNFIKDNNRLNKEGQKNEGYIKDISSYQTTLDKFEKTYNEYSLKLSVLKGAAVKEKIDKIKDDFSRYIVSCVLINAGKSSVSIREQALLRIFVSKDYYINLELMVADYEKNSSNVNSQATTVLSFRSIETNKLDDVTKTNLKKHWGSNANSILFFQDVFGKRYSTNPIPFADGVYQRKIYDDLGKEASLDKYKEKLKLQ